MRLLAVLFALLMCSAAAAAPSDDRQEVERAVTHWLRSFELFFAAIRKGASGGPPYHRLQPEDLQVQLLGTDSAVVTFHLRNSERIARRTFVMRKVQGTWLVAHLHASNFLRPSATR